MGVVVAVGTAWWLGAWWPLLAVPVALATAWFTRAPVVRANVPPAGPSPARELDPGRFVCKTVTAAVQPTTSKTTDAGSIDDPPVLSGAGAPRPAEPSTRPPLKMGGAAPSTFGGPPPGGPPPPVRVPGLGRPRRPTAELWVDLGELEIRASRPGELRPELTGEPAVSTDVFDDEDGGWPGAGVPVDFYRGGEITGTLRIGEDRVDVRPGGGGSGAPPPGGYAGGGGPGAAGLPAIEPGPPAVQLVRWSASVTDALGRHVSDGVIDVAVPYQLRSALGDAGWGAALARTFVPLTAPVGTPLRFELVASRAVLRAPGVDVPSPRVEAERVFDGVRTLPVEVTVIAEREGPIEIEIRLFAAGAYRSSLVLALVAMPVTRRVAPSGSGAWARRLTVGSIAARPASVRVEYEDRRLAIEINGKRRMGQQPADPEVIARETRKIRRELGKLSDGYAPDPAAAPFGLRSGREVTFQLAKLGARLHRLLFGHPRQAGGDRDLKAYANDIARCEHGSRLQILAPGLPFPWGLLYDGAFLDRELRTPDDVDMHSFWGARFWIDRVASSKGMADEPIPTEPVRVQPCLNPHLDAEQGVSVLADQRALFSTLPGVEVSPAIEDHASLVEFLRGEAACDVLYFFCHAKPSQSVTAGGLLSSEAVDREARICLDQGASTDALDVETMRDLRIDPLARSPFVFVNACSSATGDDAVQSRFITHFVESWGARAFVGTDWNVPTVFANAFARRFVHHAFGQRLPVADALAATAAECFAQDNPFALIYALYGRPDMMLVPKGT